jgi:hypothetical protein
MRGMMAYVNMRNVQRAAVLVVGVFLNEKQLGRLVHSIEQSQKDTISIMRLEQTLTDMEETACVTHLAVRAAPPRRHVLRSETPGWVNEWHERRAHSLRVPTQLFTSGRYAIRLRAYRESFS